MNKSIIYAMILLCMAGSASAQQSLKGQKEAGIRLGLPLGVTGRYFFTDKSAAEGIVGLYNRTFTVTALYQYHFDLSALTMDGFGWYAGGGAHLGTRDINGTYKFLGGIDGVAGINYNFGPIPLNLSLDWKPAIHFGQSSDLADFAVSARYIFGRSK